MTSEPSGIEALAQVHITVTDVDASVEFYRDVLGLRFLFRVEGQPMAFFDCGGVRLYLGTASDPDYVSKPVLYLGCRDIDRVHARLQERGAPELEPVHTVHSDGSTEIRLAFCRDPDGNRLAVMEERSVGA